MRRVRKLLRRDLVVDALGECEDVEMGPISVVTPILSYLLLGLVPQHAEDGTGIIRLCFPRLTFG